MSTQRRIRCAAICGLILCTPAQGGPRPDPAQALQAAMGQGAIQDKFPGENAAPAKPQTPPPLRPLHKPAAKFRATITDELLILLLWMLGFHGLFMLAYYLRRVLPGWEMLEHDAAAGRAAPDARAAVSTHPFELADALAAAGKFPEAMHHLLLYSVACLVERTGKPLPQSLTTREVMRSVRLAPPAQAALVALTGYVERVWFGIHPGSLADYEACRALSLNICSPRDRP